MADVVDDAKRAAGERPMHELADGSWLIRFSYLQNLVNIRLKEQGEATVQSGKANGRCPDLPRPYRPQAYEPRNRPYPEPRDARADSCFPPHARSGNEHNTRQPR